MSLQREMRYSGVGMKTTSQVIRDPAIKSGPSIADNLATQKPIGVATFTEEDPDRGRTNSTQHRKAEVSFRDDCPATAFCTILGKSKDL